MLATVTPTTDYSTYILIEKDLIPAQVLSYLLKAFLYIVLFIFVRNSLFTICVFRFVALPHLSVDQLFCWSRLHQMSGSIWQPFQTCRKKQKVAQLLRLGDVIVHLTLSRFKPTFSSYTGLQWTTHICLPRCWNCFH